MAPARIQWREVLVAQDVLATLDLHDAIVAGDVDLLGLTAVRLLKKCKLKIEGQQADECDDDHR